MGFQIDFLPIGDGSRSGDAIAFRHGNLYGTRAEQTVVIVDGGTKESAAQLVSLVREKYGTDTVDIVVSSHPDGDHTSGLTVVLEKMKVGALLMHLPWNHAGEIQHLLERRYVPGGLESALVRALANVSDLEDLAKSKGVPIYEPFSDLSPLGPGPLTILGPTKAYYQQLLCDFRETPEAKESTLAGILESLLRKASDAVSHVSEMFGVETLDESGVTSAENNSSVILHLAHDGAQALFTADAGIPALTRAAVFAASVGIDLRAMRFMQVPHHGSRRNVSPSVLNNINAASAYVSACKDGAPKHPSQRVINAITRRGGTVFCTRGVALSHTHNGPQHLGYIAATASPLVEEFDE